MKDVAGFWRRVAQSNKSPPDTPGPLPRGDAADQRRLMQQIEAPFDESRQRPWPDVIRFLEGLTPKGWLLDLACGNGRHTLPAVRLGHRVAAMDVARGLLRRLRHRLREDKRLEDALLIEADALRLPLSDASVAAAIFVAGLHCIRGRSQRRAALVELRRVLKPDAPLQLTVWWRDPRRFRGPLRRTEARLESAREAGAGHVADAGVEQQALPVEAGDVSMPWRHGVEKPVDRFFHLYTQDELEQDLLAAGFVSPRIEYVRYASTWNLIATVGPQNRGAHAEPAAEGAA